ncbi:MAG: hypothetical protein SFY92_08715 [Verrucomicrobiae bacterium]|nr:hypothetical protein [Verrucomicrobiae bacterium]
MNNLFRLPLLSAGAAVILFSGCESTRDSSAPGTMTDRTATAGSLSGAPAESRSGGAGSVRISAPEPESVRTIGRADVILKTENFDLTVPGQSIRVIVNNQTPRLHRHRNAPVVLQNLPDGGHTVRAVLVGADGTMVRNETAYAELHFYVRRKDFQNYIPPGTPSIFVNQPMGRYEGARVDDVMLDFLVRNSSGHKVRYTLNGVSTVTTDFSRPISFRGLPQGSYRLSVELLDANEQPVPGAFNRVERQFEVVRPAAPVEPSPVPAATVSVPESTPAPAPVPETNSVSPPQLEPFKKE